MPPRTFLMVGVALAALLAAPLAWGQGEPPNSKRLFNKRGVYFFKGPQLCPLAGLGSRGDYKSNRLALDDDRSRVTSGPALVIDEGGTRVGRFTRRVALSPYMFLSATRRRS
jgi:hypothetical protein